MYFQVKQAMSSSQSVAVSVPNPVQTATNSKSTSSSPAPSSEAPGAPSASEGSQTSSQTSQQQQQNEQRKAQQMAALKQVKLTTMKPPPGIDPIAVMKERESRYPTHIYIVDIEAYIVHVYLYAFGVATCHYA